MKKGVISYQDHNNQKKDLIVEIVSDVADKIELDKKTVKSKKMEDNKIDFKQFFLIKTDVCMY